MTDNCRQALVRTTERNVLVSVRVAKSALEMALTVFGARHPATTKIGRDLHRIMDEDLKDAWQS